MSELAARARAYRDWMGFPEHADGYRLLTELADALEADAPSDQKVPEVVAEAVRLAAAWRRETVREGLGANWQLAHLAHAGSEPDEAARARRREFVNRCRDEADALEAFLHRG